MNIAAIFSGSIMLLTGGYAIAAIFFDDLT